jgi:type II secretory pathway pseudopilin PulG
VKRAVRERGFTYLGVLLLVAVLGAVLAGTATVWHTLNQRDKERELLFVGHEFRKAIGLYYERSPGGAKQYPRELEDLLLDKRQPALARYLRRVYVDPITGRKQWGLVRGPGGGIRGVYSLGAGTPIKTGNFDEEDKSFEGASSYADWKFVYNPALASPLPKPAVAPAGPSSPAPVPPDAASASSPVPAPPSGQ